MDRTSLKQESAHLSPTASLVELMPGTPFRPLDWRWQVALHIIKKAKVPNAWLDPHVVTTVKFIRALQRYTDDLLQMADRFPDLYAAYLMHFSKQPHLRWAAEARVLAGETANQIAAKLRRFAQIDCLV